MSEPYWTGGHRSFPRARSRAIRAGFGRRRIEPSATPGSVGGSVSAASDEKTDADAVGVEQVKDGTTGDASADDVTDLVLGHLHSLRSSVSGVLACLVSTSDGLLIGADAPGLAAPQTAALTSTLAALARRAVQATERGELLDAVVRGSAGHLAVFAVGDTAVLAVIADPAVSVAWLHIKTRPYVQELAALASRFDRFYTG